MQAYEKFIRLTVIVEQPVTSAPEKSIRKGMKTKHLGNPAQEGNGGTPWALRDAHISSSP